MKSAIKWIEDPDAERTMEEEEFKWEIVDVPVSEIDVQRSVRYNARMGTLNEEKIDRLARCAEGHRPFKMIVLRRRGRKYEILGGNHRFQAFLRVVLESVRAYVVETDDEAKAKLLAQRLNLDIGSETDDASAAMQAFEALGNGLTITEAAKKFVVPTHKIEHLKHEAEMLEKAKEMGIHLNGTPATILERLYQLRANEPILRKILVAVHEHKATTSHVEDMLHVAKQQKTEATKLAALEKYIGDVLQEPRQPLKVAQAPKSRVKRYVTSLVNVLGDKKTARALGFTSVSDNEFLSVLQKLSKRLAQLAKEKIKA